MSDFRNYAFIVCFYGLIAPQMLSAEDIQTEIPGETQSGVNTVEWQPDAVFADQQQSVQQTSCQQGGTCQTCAPQSCDSCCCLSPFMSDHCFDSFIEPVTNPVYFIDPRSRTRVRGLFIHQDIPNDSVLGGGDLQLYAMEASLALNDRLAIIAEKDGYITMQTRATGWRKGWANIAAGLKYVIVRDVEQQFLLTGGFMYELPTGSDAVFQGNIDGVWTPFLTTGKEFADGRAHFIGTAGWHLPNNKNKDTESLYYSVHLDYEVFCGWYALWEFNGIAYTESGSRLPVIQEGGDLINLGSNNVAGNHVATTAIGVTRVFNQNLSAAAAYEVPVTNREDLLDSRVTATVTLTY